MKYKGINNVQSLINIKDGSLYYVSNQSLYYLSGSQKDTVQNRISGSNFINHNNFLTYSTYADGDKLNTVKSTVFLKNFLDGKTKTFSDTYAVLYCNNKNYYYKPSGYFSAYVTDETGKKILPPGIYENIFCLGDSFYYFSGEGDGSNKLKAININTLKPVADAVDIGSDSSKIFYNDEYFYYADTSKIITYDSKLQKTETDAFGIKTALTNNSNGIIYYIQPPVQIDSPRGNNYSDTIIMKFDLTSKKTIPVAKLKLDSETDLMAKSVNGLTSQFKQVLYNENTKTFYVLLGDKIYGVKN